MIVIVAILAACLSYFAVNQLEPEYRARSTFVMTQLDTRVRAADVELESFELTSAIIETEMDILRSRDFAEDVAQSLNLLAGETTDPAVPSQMREQVIDQLLAAYSVFRTGESLAIEVVAQSAEPKMAADIANTVVQNYIAHTERQRSVRIDEAIEFLRQRVVELSDELAEAEVELAGFIRQENLDDETLSEQLRADEARLSATAEAMAGDSSAGARTRAAEIEARAAEVREVLENRTRAELELLRRERAIELLRIRYQSAVERLNELESQPGFLESGARQITVASVPFEPAWPNKELLIAAGTGLGLLLAAALVLLLETSNMRLTTETRVASVTGVLNFGHVPRVRRWRPFKRFSPIRSLQSDPHGPYAKAISRLLTLWLNLRGPARVLMVASGAPNEGKSTTAVSLALVAAREGLNVLLIDFDRHRHGATRNLGVNIRTVVPQAILNDEAKPLTVNLDDGGRYKLDVIALDIFSGGEPAAAKGPLQALKHKLRSQYDMIVLDTPPTLAVDDVLRLRELAENTILVVRWGQTTVDTLTETMQQLDRNGINVTGTIIADVDARKHRRYGYGGYIHYPGYESPD